jgi:hypothetical protein
VGEHREGDVPVPGVVAAGLVVVEADLVLRRLGWVGRAARFPLVRVLFRAASRRTGRARFPGIRLSSDYAVRVTAGSRVWMWSWRPAQTTRVLRRRLAMAVTHGAGSSSSRSASLRT